MVFFSKEITHTRTKQVFLSFGSAQLQALSHDLKI